MQTESARKNNTDLKKAENFSRGKNFLGKNFYKMFLVRTVIAAFSVVSFNAIAEGTGTKKDQLKEKLMMKEEMQKRNQWVKEHLLEAKPNPSGTTSAPGCSVLPFSFIYDGKPSAELLKMWKVERKSNKLDSVKTEHIITYTDPATGLVLTCRAIEYSDFPTIEWIVYFKNTGTADTPILEKIQALDICLVQDEKDDFVLHHNIGSPASPKDYAPIQTALSPKATKRIAAAGGRPTKRDMSYFNVACPGEGLIVVVGWPGQWVAEFTRNETNGLHIVAGQELTHLKLHPGEQIRTPLMVLQFWKGDRIHSQNIWRRWMLAYNLPKPGGKELVPLSAGISHCNSSAAEEKIFMDRYLGEDLKPDWWWQDAGWFIQKSPRFGEAGNTGTWEVDKQRYPDGLRGITDYAHSKGMKTIVWFEPERVTEGTWLAKEHPEWILWSPGHDKLGRNKVRNGLLDLGNPEAWNWLVNHIDQFMTKEGIDHYRQDFNMDPLNYWRTNDAEDRQGITEIKHVTGYLAFWDELLRRHPDMIIDTCASGGRRNDLETLRRSVPLWRSDYGCHRGDPVGMQCQTYGLSFWVPYFGTGVMGDDPYVVRSHMTPFFLMMWDMKNKLASNASVLIQSHPKTPLNTVMLRRLVGQWRSIAAYYLGYYYPLTSYSLKNDVWMAWQFDRPDLGEGMLQVFRRADSIYESDVFKLQGLEASAVYKITNMDIPDKTTEITGKQLMESGLKVAIDRAPHALILVYKRYENP